MIEASVITQIEYTRYQTYEHQRRARLLGVLIPAGTLLTGLTTIAAAIALTAQGIALTNGSWLNTGITAMLCLLFGIAWRCLRQDRLEIATSLTIAGGGGGVIATVVLATLGGLTPLSLIQVVSLAMVIVLVGLLGGLPTILGATALTSAITVLLLIFAPRSAELRAFVDAQLPLIIAVTLIYQWALSALMIALWQTYRQTLQALGSAFERAQQLDALKEQFITHVNHELRTPIMTLHGYVEFMREALPTLPPEAQAAALEKASRTGQTLLSLLSSLLAVRRIDQLNDFEVGPVNLRAALDAALLLVDPRLGLQGSRELQIAIADHLTVLGESVRIQQILTNLLSNAVKYSPADAPIQVQAQIANTVRTATRSTPTQPMITITVRDFGLGIPPDQATLLFNRFVRLPRDLASTTPGTGLGLYLCRVYAKAMGGNIWVESSGVAGEGSTFFLLLPLAPAEVLVPVPVA